MYAIYFKGEEQHSNYRNRGGGFPGGGGRGGGIGFPGGGYPGGGGRGGGGGQQRGGGTEPRVDGKKILERITGETGGRLFEVSKKETVAAIYTQIAEELRSQYRLGYTPDALASADGITRLIFPFRRRRTSTCKPATATTRASSGRFLRSSHHSEEVPVRVARMFSGGDSFDRTHGCGVCSTQLRGNSVATGGAS